MNEERSRQGILELHARVDAEAERLHGLHAERLHCRMGCSACCVDELSVFGVEAQRIEAWVGEGLRGEEPAPAGACAFLDSRGGCRIYPARPYVCRTQGLPLRWLDHQQAAEHRDICPLNEPGPDLLSLPTEACWELGPWEAELAALESLRVGDEAERERLSLRELFDKLSR